MGSPTFNMGASYSLARPEGASPEATEILPTARALAKLHQMDKQDLLAQLVRQLEASARAALQARDGAALEAREGATPDEKREDARAAHQLATLGGAQQRRAQQALA